MDMTAATDEVKTTLRLPRELHNRLRHVAIDLNRDMNSMIVEMIERFLATKKGGR
jgi:predicted DNA-binding protein